MISYWITIHKIHLERKESTLASMQPVSTNDVKSRPEIVRLKQTYGTLYGVIAGLAFAASTWGWDGFLLSQAHAFLPWTKLIIGGVCCAIAGGLVGWLSTRLDKGIITVILWLVAAAIFSWLNVNLPLRTALLLSERAEPQLQGLITPGLDATLQIRFQMAFAWIVIFTGIVGVLEIPLVDSAVFSTSLFGKAIPGLVCVIVLGIGGTFADNVNNEPLRSAVISLDQTIQFVIDNQGKEVDPALARQKHTGSIRGVVEYLSPERRLILSRFDEQFGQIGVIVKFENGWVDCNIIYRQPSFCKTLTLETP